jgi:hypothetical protein
MPKIDHRPETGIKKAQPQHPLSTTLCPLQRPSSGQAAEGKRQDTGRQPRKRVGKRPEGGLSIGTSHNLKEVLAPNFHRMWYHSGKPLPESNIYQRTKTNETLPAAGKGDTSNQPTLKADIVP